jgi:hypothetical protein
MNPLVGVDSKLIATAIGAGVVCGFVSAYFMLSMPANLFVWGFAGVTIGHFMQGGWDTVLKVGALYGLILTLSFLFFSFGASFDYIIAHVVLTLALGMVGAICGVMSAMIGSFLKPYLIFDPAKKYF